MVDGNYCAVTYCLAKNMMPVQVTETIYFPKDHMGVHIANNLREFLTSWHLEEDKQVCDNRLRGQCC